jgi:hypothetical protein
MPWPKSTGSAITARRAAAGLLLLLAAVGLASRAEALQRVVFVDRTVLEVEDAWADDRYVHFVYHGRPITVLRSDVARIEGTRPTVPPRSAPVCRPPRPGDDDQAVREYFRCLGVSWVRAPILEHGQQLWVYEGRVEDRLERYVLKNGRILDVQPPVKPSAAP